MEQKVKVPTLEKPCIRQCCLNEKDICMGCFRTFDDMMRWRQCSQKEKLAILHRAKERKEKHKTY